MNSEEEQQYDTSNVSIHIYIKSHMKETSFIRIRSKNKQNKILMLQIH